MRSISSSAKRVILSFINRVSKDAEIPVGLSDQQIRMFHTWSIKGNNPHIKTINGNLHNNPEGYPFKGLTKMDKEDLLAWIVYRIQNTGGGKKEAPTTESSEDLLESKGKMFKTEKDLDKHLAKQLTRVYDSGLEKQLIVKDNDSIKFDNDKKK